MFQNICKTKRKGFGKEKYITTQAQTSYDVKHVRKLSPVGDVRLLTFKWFCNELLQNHNPEQVQLNWS